VEKKSRKPSVIEYYSTRRRVTPPPLLAETDHGTKTLHRGGGV